MGQRDDYLASDEDWHHSLSLADRDKRWPVQSSFAIGIGDRGASAIEHARDAVMVAQHVLTQVKEQAVYALLVEQQSVREIAAATGLPKSEVGRIAKRLGGAADPRSLATLPPRGFDEVVRRRVREAWGEPVARITGHE